MMTQTGDPFAGGGGVPVGGGCCRVLLDFRKLAANFFEIETMSHLTTVGLGILCFLTSLQAQSDLVQVRGRIVCVEAGSESQETIECPSEAPVRALLDENGHLYRFLPADPKVTMFDDPRVRVRELQVTGRLHPSSDLEIIRVKTIVDGRLHHVYYRCEVCHITAYAYGPCWCCQDEFEFRETVTPPPQ